MTDQLHAGFVLHRKPYSDSSLLLELFCDDYGRQPVIARAARRSGRRSPVLQPFLPLWLGWRGKGEVKTLTNAEPRGEPNPLSGKRLYCALYLNELIARLVPRGEAPDGLFHDYSATLEALARGSEVEPLLRRFELGLLEHLGYGLCLSHTAATGQPVRPDGYYVVEPLQGVIEAPETGAGVRSYRGSTLLAMERLDFSDARVRDQCRSMIRRLIDFHLGHRPLKSRELFRQSF